MSETNSLRSVFQRLEKITEEVFKTQAYNDETEKLRILLEMTREQVQDENSYSSVSQTR